MFFNQLMIKANHFVLISLTHVAIINKYQILHRAFHTHLKVGLNVLGQNKDKNGIWPTRPETAAIGIWLSLVIIAYDET